MAILSPKIKILPAGQTERIKDGCTEHMHAGYDYWHPVARVHSGNQISTHRNIDTTRTMWGVDEDGVYDIIEAVTGRQAGYIDILGEYVKLPLVCEMAGLPGDILSAEWCIALSERFDLELMMTIGSGQLREVTILSGSGDVRFCLGYAHFEEGSMLHNAKILFETGIVSMYVDNPDLADAMHVLNVSDGGAYYDLIRLPNGGHIPVEILVREYGVSWETIAKIPLGKPRDNKTFACPICEETSFFAGVCGECDDICHDCDSEYHCETSGPCMYYVEKKEILDEVGMKRFDRKEFEHGAILRMIKSGNFSRCRYMRGGD